MSGQVELLPCVNPATREQFDQIRMASPEEIEQAPREMRQAFEVWRRKPVRERVRILRKLQAMVIDSADIITETINLDTGKSRQDGLIEVLMCVDRLHQYYRQAPAWLARRRVPPGLYIFRRFYTQPEPFGVVAVIAPWNYPFDLMMSPMCSALLAGNTVLLKPSEAAGATGALVEKLIQSVPELSPFVRVLHGDGRVGAALVKSKPDFIFLTGSVSTGRKVAMAIAEDMIPYAFELGGKDPMIVLEDADIEAAARWGTWGAYYNTGQTCQGIERVYVLEPVYERFVDLAVQETKKLRMGYSADRECPYDMGPLSFERQKRIVEDHLEDALAKGARILVGGGIEGMFAEPTVIVDVDHSMKLMREETFGPILPIMKVKDEAEAIRAANDSDLGLSASVWSRDLKRAQRVAHELEVGSVNINDAISQYPVSLLPFGGLKGSGLARTHGKEEVMQFTHLRSFAVGRPPIAIDLATQMRQPGHYRLGKAVLRLAFGVRPDQRIQPIVEEAERLQQRAGERKPATLAAAGILTSLALLLFSLWRRSR